MQYSLVTHKCINENAMPKKKSHTYTRCILEMFYKKATCNCHIRIVCHCVSLSYKFCQLLKVSC